MHSLRIVSVKGKKPLKKLIPSGFLIDSADSPGSAREAEPEDEGIEQDQDEDHFRRSGVCQKIFRVNDIVTMYCCGKVSLHFQLNTVCSTIDHL